MWQTTVQFPTAVNITVYVIAVVLALLGFFYIWRRGRAAGFVMRWTTQDILVLAIMGVLLEVYDNLIGDQFITFRLSTHVEPGGYAWSLFHRPVVRFTAGGSPLFMPYSLAIRIGCH